MKTKKDKAYSFNHVNERLIERFDSSPMTMELFDELSDRFKNDKSTRILIENEDQEIHQISDNHKTFTFVYSTQRGYITTVLKW